MNVDQVELDRKDVICTILQFLKENNFNNSLKCLQQESAVSLNMVPDLSSFLKNIENGEWDIVLFSLAGMEVPLPLLFSLYEQIFVELCEVREFETASYLLKNTDSFKEMKAREPNVFKQLESLLERCKNTQDQLLLDSITKTLFDPAKKQVKRKKIADSFVENDFGFKITQAKEPSILLKIIGKAMKWDQHQKQLQAQPIIPTTSNAIPSSEKPLSYEIFEGNFTKETKKAVPQEEILDEKVITQIPLPEPFKEIKFGKNSHCNCCSFTSDGKFLVTGSNDGVIEIYDWKTGALDTEVCVFQNNEENLMLHDDSVLCLALNDDISTHYSSSLVLMGPKPYSELKIASGTSKGTIYVWDFLTGKCDLEIKQAHFSGISTICFTKSGGLVCSGSFDGTIRIHGLFSSGQVLKEFKEHDRLVSRIQLFYMPSQMQPKDAKTFGEDVENEYLISSSDDGSLKIWDTKTMKSITTLKNFAIGGQSQQQGGRGAETLFAFPPSSGGMVETSGNKEFKKLSEDSIHWFEVLIPNSSQIQEEGNKLQKLQFVICNSSNSIFVVDIKGNVLKTFVLYDETESSASAQEKKEQEKKKVGKKQFVSFTISRRGKGPILFALSEDKKLTCFNIENGAMISKWRASGKELITVKGHPSQNVICTSAKDGKLKIWK